MANAYVDLGTYDLLVADIGGTDAGSLNIRALAGNPGAYLQLEGGAGNATDSGGYTVRLRYLERSVSELKEQVFRTKARLQLLKETVLGGVIGASQALIKHRNEMGSSFRLVKVVYALDGVRRRVSVTGER